MIDYKKMTDKQINEKLQSFPNTMVLLDKNGKRKAINYVENDGFCSKLIRGNKIDVNWNSISKHWVASKPTENIKGYNINLNRAVIECYLKIKEEVK